MQKFTYKFMQSLCRIPFIKGDIRASSLLFLRGLAETPNIFISISFAVYDHSSFLPKTLFIPL